MSGPAARFGLGDSGRESAGPYAGGEAAAASREPSAGGLLPAIRRLRPSVFLARRFADWIRRRQGEDAPPLRLHRRRLYVLPTRIGLGAAALLFFMLVAGLNYANSLALFITFLFAGFVLVGMHRCHRNLMDTTVLAAATMPAFAGGTGTVQLTLGNDSRLARLGLEASAVRGYSAVADLPPGGSVRLDLPVPAPRRGLVRVDRLRLETTQPFGLFRTWTWLHLPLSVVVYPRPRGSLPPPASSGIETGVRSRGGAGEDEWLGLRPFRDGDSPRQVAWKAYARGAPLLVKEYGASGSELRLFDFGRLAGLDTEARLEQLARWIVDAEARGDRYGLVLPGQRIEPGRGIGHRHRCLEALALFGLPGDARDGAS